MRCLGSRARMRRARAGRRGVGCPRGTRGTGRRSRPVKRRTDLDRGLALRRCGSAVLRGGARGSGRGLGRDGGWRAGRSGGCARSRSGTTWSRKRRRNSSAGRTITLLAVAIGVVAPAEVNDALAQGEDALVADARCGGCSGRGRRAPARARRRAAWRRRPRACRVGRAARRLGSTSAGSAPRSRAWSRAARNLPRKTFESARTGKRKRVTGGDPAGAVRAPRRRPSPRSAGGGAA